MYVINVFGLGVLYRVLELPIALVASMEDVAKQAKVDFSDVVFDFELMEKCGYCSFSDLPFQTLGIGAMIHKDTRFEIRQQRKKIKHFPLDDLFSQEYLFPMYHLKSIDFNVQRKEGFEYFYLYQVIKGRVMKYLMHTFHGIDSLEFETTQFTIENQSFELLSGINQHGEPLLLENDDSVIIEQRVLKL
jgi:hypothetical protein